MVLQIEEKPFQSGRMGFLLTVNRPEALNALNREVMESLEAAFSQIQKRKDIVGVVITGAGEKSFVAGADISEFKTMDTAAARKFAECGQALFRKFSKLPYPVVAAVNGFALGGGCELALACDFIFASPNAKFGLPECTLGLIPGFGGTVRLHRRVGTARALEWTMSGQMITAEEAEKVGLVNRVYPQVDLIKAAIEYLGQVSLRAPLAVASIKQSIVNGEDMGGAAADQLEAQLFAQCFETQDQKEGTQAFLEKRKPQFKGL